MKGKRVLVRCDFNVPLDARGEILNDFKIKETLPTIRYLIEKKAKIILMSHLGEPQGKVVPALNLNKVRDRIEKLLDIGIMKSFESVGRDVENQASRLKRSEIMLLENLRFRKEEKENNVKFARQLSLLGDIYINDAFASCHRAHASVALVPALLPSGAGFLLKKELDNLNKILKKPKKPLIAIVGGIKSETKSRLVDSISSIADAVIISGLIKKELLDKNIKLKHQGKIISPEDNLDALDIDEKTMGAFVKKIASAKTIFWNGPFGRFEDEKYKKGTLAIASAIIASKAFSVVGGGETLEFLFKEGITGKFSHVSTGGGAMLSYLAGETMPGLEVLK